MSSSQHYYNSITTSFLDDTVGWVRTCGFCSALCVRRWTRHAAAVVGWHLTFLQRGRGRRAVTHSFLETTKMITVTVKTTRFCPRSKKTSFKMSLTLETLPIPKNPSLEQSLFKKYIVWLHSYTVGLHRNERVQLNKQQTELSYKYLIKLWKMTDKITNITIIIHIDYILYIQTQNIIVYIWLALRLTCGYLASPIGLDIEWTHLLLLFVSILMKIYLLQWITSW